MSLENKEDVLGTIDELGLKITKGDVEVGGTYPIFGMITSIEESDDGTLIAEINHSIKAHMVISDNAKVELLKSRAFETGIFVSKVLSKEPIVEVECQAVVFGRSQSFNA